MNVPFVDLAQQYASLESELMERLEKALEGAHYILGEEVAAFEEEFASYCQARYGVGVASGTDALHLALLACGVGPGDEVITVANTFIATVLAISYTGARPVLVDIDPENYNMDIEAARRAMTKKTKAIIPVHLYGQPANMDPILAMASEHGARVVEDACQAHGAEYRKRRVGSIGDVGCFSFYPSKNLGACGDGGMVVTNDEVIAKNVKMLRNYGSRVKYHHELKGFNSRLDTIQAALLRVKLTKLDQWNDARRKAALQYNELLNGTGPVTPREEAYAKHVYHLYVLRVKKRNSLSEHLASKGISTVIHYPIPIHLLDAYRELGYEKGDFPVTERYAEEVLSLPMFPEIAREQIEYVSEQVKNFPPA